MNREKFCSGAIALGLELLKGTLTLFHSCIVAVVNDWASILLLSNSGHIRHQIRVGTLLALGVLHLLE